MLEDDSLTTDLTRAFLEVTIILVKTQTFANVAVLFLGLAVLGIFVQKCNEEQVLVRLLETGGGPMNDEFSVSCKATSDWSWHSTWRNRSTFGVHLKLN